MLLRSCRLGLEGENSSRRFRAGPNYNATPNCFKSFPEFPSIGLLERQFVMVPLIAYKCNRPATFSRCATNIDLSILGKGKERFWEYEEQIRQEYAWVPETLFSAKRAEILDRFLARKAIYATEWFRKKYERQARHNLEVSILELRRRT